MEMNGFAVYYHWKHGWFYSLEHGNRKWMDWLHVNRLKRLYKH